MWKADAGRRAARRRAVPGALLLAGLTLGAALTGCGDQKLAAASAPPARDGAVGGEFPEVLATIDGQRITMEDVRARVGDNLAQNETRFRVTQHKLVDNALRDILADRLLAAEAKKQGKTVDQLLAAEVGGSLEPSEVEIAAWYRENQARTGGRALAQISTEIGNYLRKTRRNEATEKLEERLKLEQKVDVKYSPYRLTFDNAGAPARGPAGAAVTVVEFSDFECPFCGRFYPTLKRLEEQYGDKVRIVYRQFPLTDIHQNAFKAAEASLCAQEQGKFWELHDLMFQEQSQLTLRDLKVKANRLGLDQKKFDTCLDTGRFTAQVQADMREGERVGVSGTPALFVNGVALEGGAVPYETVAKAIERELRRAQR